MKSRITETSDRQVIFREMVVGTLLYTVVLGFFDDYSDILTVKNYSIILAAALVLQLLTYATFSLKGGVVGYLRKRAGRLTKLQIVFAVWLIMFLSKFVFIEVIDIIFGHSVDISGFFGILVLVAVMTVARKTIDAIYTKLA